MTFSNGRHLRWGNNNITRISINNKRMIRHPIIELTLFNKDIHQNHIDLDRSQGIEWTMIHNIWIWRNKLTWDNNKKFLNHNTYLNLSPHFRRFHQKEHCHLNNHLINLKMDLNSLLVWMFLNRKWWKLIHSNSN